MKKRFLELLIMQAGFTPKEVQSYRTDGCDGQFDVKIGWRGIAVDSIGQQVFSFHTPEGFNDAVKEVQQSIYGLKDLKFITLYDFKL